MLATSTILAELIEKQFRTDSDSARDFRLLVPGLTNRIADEVHRFLLEKGVPSFLVIGPDGFPNESGRLIRAIGLTSKRIGSFVAIASPGQLTNIQDSVRGSGGAIRSLAFSEEWPWIDNGNERYRFHGPVLDAFVESWSDDARDQEWLREFVTSGLLESTRSSPKRAEMLLEDILGKFDSKRIVGIDNIRPKLLFHSGVARPAATSIPVKNLIRDSVRLSTLIVARCQAESEIRAQARENIAELFPADIEGVCTCLDKFLDAVGVSTTLDLGLLSFYGCWGSGTGNVAHWDCLTADRLADIFEVRERERSECTYGIRCQRGLVSREGKHLATFIGEEITVAINFKIPENDFVSGRCSAQVMTRKKQLGRVILESREGAVSVTFNSTDCSKRAGGSFPIRIELLSDEDVLADAKLKVDVCGADRPAFLLVYPDFETFDAYPESEVEASDRKIVVEEAVDIYLFNDLGVEGELRDEEESEIELKQVLPGIQCTAQRIDVAAGAQGSCVVAGEVGGLLSVVSIQASDLERGEFTLEDELRVLLCGMRDKRLDEVIQLFEGKRKDGYPALGGIDATARLRTYLAETISNSEGWRPALANLLVPLVGAPKPQGNFFLQLGDTNVAPPAVAALSAKGAVLLGEYVKAREAFITEVRSRLTDSEREHPLYASHPLYVEERATYSEEILAAYTETYGNILSYVETARTSLEWSELFVLLHLDCVVHWDNTSAKGCFYLVGPWHPLVLGKRFMVQKALLDRGHRLQRDKGSGRMFRQLATLLARVNGFRWVFSLSADGPKFEPAYVVQTSDPGWHLAFKTSGGSIAAVESIGGLLKVRLGVRQFIGLRIDLGEGASQGLVGAVVNSYLRSFPSRRSVGIRVRQGYAPADIVESSDTILHSESGLSGQLPGGIRLYLQEALTENVDAKWTDPPLLVYRFDRDEDLFLKTFPDVYLLPPSGEMSFSTSDSSYAMPRGTGMSAAFYSPLQWLTEGLSQVPKSFSYELDETIDGESGIGGAYRRSLAQIARSLGGKTATVSSVDLPTILGASWVVVPGRTVDPAIMVKYVRDGIDRDIQERALWDYRYDLSGRTNSFFVLSVISKGFQVAVNGFFGEKDVATSFISELGRIGIAIGGEALRSGRHALGVVGLVGAIRLMIGTKKDIKTPLSARPRSIGFLLPVDAFSSFFGKSDQVAGLRADLLAVRIGLPRDSSGRLRITAWGVESKFVTATLTAARAGEALDQASATEREFRDLVRASLREGGIPERLAVLELVRFGLRIVSPNKSAEIAGWIDIERVVCQAILAGLYEYTESPKKAVVVSTEGGLQGVAEYRDLLEGIWVRLTRAHWPEVAETLQLQAIRENLLKTLAAADNEQEDPAPAVPSPIPETQPVEESSPTPESVDRASGEAVGGHPVALKGILVGVDASRHPVLLDPQSPTDPLDNLNLMITGSSGTGKTQLLKYLVCEFRKQGKNVFLLDFKNDFAGDQTFCEIAGLTRVYVNFAGLPYNPLIPYPIRHKDTGELYLQCGQYIAGVTSVLRSTYGLGVQQQMAVKKAIVEAFDSAGIPTTGTIAFSGQFDFPDLSAVGSILEHTYPSAYSRLDPLFTLNLFQNQFRTQSFQSLVGGSYVLDLSQIPSDEIKSALAQLMVLSAHSYYNTQQHSGEMRQLLVFDEAHRVMATDFMLRLVRECRAYGVGTLLSSQYPTDFPPEISASMATKVVHGNGPDAERVKAIAQMLGYLGREGEIANLSRFQAIFYNRHYPGELIRTVNFPVYLVWSKLRESGKATLEELSEVPGVDTAKLPMKNLLQQLELLGLAETRSDGVYLLARAERA